MPWSAFKEAELHKTSLRFKGYTYKDQAVAAGINTMPYFETAKQGCGFVSGSAF